MFDNTDPHPPELQKWEELVRSCEQSGIMQSIFWARFKRQQGYRTLQVLVFDDQYLVGGTICYMANPSRGACVMVSPEGPVIPWQDDRQALKILVTIQDEVSKFACANDMVGWRIEPRLCLPASGILKAFRRAPFDLLPQETLYLDLRGNAADILGQMRPKGRYNIRLSMKHGVTVREIEPSKSAHVLYPLLIEAAQRDGFFVEPLSFFIDLINTLSPEAMLRCYVAEHDEEVLGAILVSMYGQRATYLYGGISSGKRNLMAGYLLQWQAILESKDANCHFYDFYGYDPFGVSTDLYARFSQFKRQFGGQVLRFVGGRDLYFVEQLADVVVKAVQELNFSQSNNRFAVRGIDG